MTLLLSIIKFIVMYMLVGTAESLLNGSLSKEERTKTPKSNISFTDEDGVLKGFFKVVKEIAFNEGSKGRAIVIGLIPAVVNLLLLKYPDLAILFAAAILGTMIYLCYWWQKEFESVNEFFTFAVMEFLLFMELKATASMIGTWVSAEGIWKSLVAITPVLVLIATLGFCAVSALSFNDKITAKRATAVGTVVVLLLTALFNIKSNAAVVTAAEGPWYHFYNSDLQKDEDVDNDFNFGPTAYTEETTAEMADKEFRERISKDPALGAADMAWFDFNVKTRYLGVFYDEADEQWDAAINKAKESWIESEEKYKETYKAFFTFLDKAVKVEIIERTGLDDQMYMNPATANGVPDVIVMETEDHTGHFLRYTFKIKDQEVTVDYRLECGFQPTNVTEMNIPITPRPTRTSENPTPNPTPTRPLKDPSKSNVLPNDDNGPGENTNSGGRESTKDMPTNSNHMTYPEYKNIMEELKEINETQKVGGDPNTPSTPTPADTTVHSNADEGTGYGGADDSTPVSELPKTEGGETIKNNASNAGQPWVAPTH